MIGYILNILLGWSLALLVITIQLSIPYYLIKAIWNVAHMNKSKYPANR